MLNFQSQDTYRFGFTLHDWFGGSSRYVKNAQQTFIPAGNKLSATLIHGQLSAITDLYRNLLTLEISTARTMWRWSRDNKLSPLVASHTRAEKSADPETTNMKPQNLARIIHQPVAARVASRFSFADQTAPLWPSKVPIQSPELASRSIGSLSRQALTKK